MNLTPLDDRVIILPDTAPEKTPGGILLPDAAKERPRMGKVLAVGPGKIHPASGQRNPMTVKVNDKVCYSPYAGNQITHPEYGILIIAREDDLLAVVEG